MRTAERAVAAAAKAEAKEQRKRKKADARRRVVDKENVNPNVSTAARAALQPTRFMCTVVEDGGRAVLRMKKSV